MTIISRDCIGGVVYHQYGIQFLSPTINMFFDPYDFNVFCINLTEYIKADLVQDKENTKNYPVGILKPKNKSLKDIKLYFMHYESYEFAKAKWENRVKRINLDNIYVISNLTNQEDTTIISKELIDDFNAIPFKKIIFVDKHYGFDSEFILKKPNNSDHGWSLLPVSSLFTWKLVINKFNFNRFFRLKK